MRRWLIVFAFVIWPLSACADRPQNEAQEGIVSQSENVLKDLSLVMLDGSSQPASQFADKVVLIVNVASRCGFTPQYDGLQALYEEFKEQGLVVVGVPCNQFGSQEPGTAEEIQSFCRLNYGVEFPLLDKQDVNGAQRSELYKRLVSSQVGKGKDIKWNFEKFIVGRDGTVVNRFSSVTGAKSSKLRQAIEAALAGK